MASRPPVARAKSSSSLLPTHSIIQDISKLPEQSDKETDLELDREIKTNHHEISKLPVTIPHPTDDIKMDNESTSKIDQNNTCAVPSSDENNSHQIHEKDAYEQFFEWLGGGVDMPRCDLSEEPKQTLNASSSNKDNLCKEGSLSYSNTDVNKHSRELNKDSLMQSQSQISRDDTILGEADSSQILSLEECKKMEPHVFNRDTEKQPESGGSCFASNQSFLLNKIEQATGDKRGIEFEVDLSLTPDIDTVGKSSDFIEPAPNEAIQLKESGTTELKTDKSTLDSISKPNDMTETEIGLAALTKANKNTRYTPFLVLKSVEQKDDPIPLGPFRQGVECAGSECEYAKVLINGQPYELLPSKGNGTKPIHPQFEMSSQEFVQSIKVPDAMEANQLPINKELKPSTFPHNLNDCDIKPPQSSTWNHPQFQSNFASKISSSFLSNETQFTMNEARQMNVSVKSMMVETRGKSKTSISSNSMISSQCTQAQGISIHNRLTIADARIEKLSSEDLLAASSLEKQEDKAGSSLGNMTTEFLRASEVAGEDPLIYDSEDGRPMEYPIERLTRISWGYRPKNYVHTQADNFDNIAVQRSERWGCSKPITLSAGNSELSDVTYTRITREESHPENVQKLRKPTYAEVVDDDVTTIEANNGRTSIVRDLPVIPVLPTQAEVTDSATKSEDGWVMADDESEEWEML
ncbi:hypothetical protein EYC84_003771 [Monilinia fructicola]|uniref:Uncharacterized protein n=1 Tax=Monilinia fructicola TaxID=38448 RepID=A0A5M9JXC2_MONFR|nr:hypothetical protein EYC84_003771 [Monilinia fructicola]